MHTIAADAATALRRLLPTAMALAVAAFALSFAPPKTIGPPWLLAVLVALSLLWALLQPPGMQRDDTLPAIAIVLSAVGLLLVARLSPQLAHKQQYWLLVSLALAVALGPGFTLFRRMAAYKYVWVLLSFVLFVLLLFLGQESGGARLWIKLGPVQYEPVELIKLFIVFFLAAYLGETADVIARARPWSIRANLKYLGPLFLGWGASMAILILQRDIGMSALLLATFAVLLYAATRRVDLLVGSLAVFGGVAVWVVRHYHYVGTRIAVWRNPFADPLGAGYQASQGYYSLAAGGIFGTGYRLGHPGFIPDVATDYIYAALSEEFGLIGAIVVLALFLLLVRRIIAIAGTQPDLYTRLLAVGLGATLGFQVFIIVGGVIGLFPLTGITLPFISYGGSSLVANFVLVSLAWAMSARPLPQRA
ncbi:MAG TPA: FtsW/RodA/SpoVE family cell cycle protein [Candidatus Baltobacteraceae bacterium]|nr:FtsW/RodA/SpoVE family cell cycle protein [Candidatus Baltobacteraceae bacterium]